MYLYIFGQPQQINQMNWTGQVYSGTGPGSYRTTQKSFNNFK